MTIEFIIKNILPLIFSVIAIIISCLALWYTKRALEHTKTREDKIDEERDFEIKFGIEKELLNNKISILHAANYSLEESVIFFFDYDNIINDEADILIPIDIKLSNKWWLENANSVSQWSISTIHRYSKIYESISLLDSKRNQLVKGKLIKDILNKLDNSTYIWQYKLFMNYHTKGK
jgi:hypothetical protein